MLLSGLVGFVVAVQSTTAPVPTLPRIGFSNAATAEERQKVIERLAQAQAIAATDQPLPFELSCIDREETGVCQDLGRHALVSIPLDRLRMMVPVFDRRCAVEDGGCRAEQTIMGYRLSFPFTAGKGYSWTVEISPAQGLERIQLYRSYVTYHESAIHQ